MTIIIAWWVIPTVILAAGTIYALFIHDDGGGYLSGIGNLLLLIPVLVVSLIAFIIAAVFK